MPTTARSLVLAFAAFAALGLSGCASDGGPGDNAPERPSVERPEGLTPPGVTAMRESLSDRRSESRDLMDSTLDTARAVDAPESGGPGLFDFLGFLGRLPANALATVSSVVSAQTFGIW